MRAALIAFVLLLLFALLPPVQAQSTKTVKETFALDADGEVQIDTYKGSITVTTWDRPKVELEVTIEPDEDEELVDLTEIKIDRSERRLSLETDYEKVEKARKKGVGPFSWGNGSTSLPFAHYTLRMPRTAALTIGDYKSAIKLANFEADVEVETYKGTIDVKTVQGSLDIETYKGEVALVLPADAGFRLDADLSRRGDLDTDLFDPNDLRRDPDDDDQQYQGIVGSGGPRLELDTYKGSFSLRSR